AVGTLIGALVLSPSTPVSAKPEPASGPYYLTLVVTPNAVWNSTTTAPRYWVLTPNGLKSSANISIPAHTLIVMTIVDYDSPSPLPSQYAQVSGTVGNKVYVFNGTANIQAPPNSQSTLVNTTGASAVSWINPNTAVSHTFTVPQLGINIPSAGGTTEVAEFYVNQTGVFTWHCMDPCGFGPSGWLGPMSAPGWMGGTLTVYSA
ncbi:MAG: hypothetical protein QXI37_02210, partial [Thermoprotei archaeon]